MHLLRKALLVGGLSLALVGAGAGVAAADAPHPAPQVTAAPRPAALPQRDDRTQTVSGTVVRADRRTLVVRTADRRTAQLSLSPRTEITKNGRRVSAGTLRPGDRVRVTAERGTAIRVDVTGR